MKPFERAYVPDEEIEIIFQDVVNQWTAGDPEIRKAYPITDPERFRKELWAQLQEMTKADEVWRNDMYQVVVRKVEGEVFHLSIKRLDRQPIHDWRDLQEIKNMLIGPEHEAAELYPAESRKVDSANQYHLWGRLDPAWRFPFGFQTRMVSARSIGKSVNREEGK